MKNKDKKSRKKLFVTLALLFGLAGVGTAAFAGYVLSEVSVGDVPGPTITDIEIENKNVSITGELAESTTLLFYPETVVEEGRVRTDEAGNLTLTLQVTVTNPETLDGENITVKVGHSAKSEETDAVDAGYITVPEVDPQAVAGSLTFSLEFGWGTEFDNTDPCTYYNTGAGSETPIATVETELEAFKTALANTAITITLGHEVAA